MKKKIKPNTIYKKPKVEKGKEYSEYLNIKVVDKVEEHKNFIREKLKKALTKKI